MKRKNFILIVLICCLSLSACADSTKQSVNNGKKVSEATPEPTMDPVSAEENVINRNRTQLFYRIVWKYC